jgi:hypothetical protein
MGFVTLLKDDLEVANPVALGETVPAPALN